MNDALKDKPLMLVAVLGAVCIVAAVALGFVAAGTHDRIEAERARGERDALSAVQPDAARFDRKTAAVGDETRVYYEAYDASGTLIGYASEGHATGYSSTIKLTVGLDRELTKITGVRITSQQETPGLGANCVKGGAQKYIWELFAPSTQSGEAAGDWQSTFKDDGLELFTREGKSYHGVDALSGATITTNAVVRAIYYAVETVYKAKDLDLPHAISAATTKTRAEEAQAH